MAKASKAAITPGRRRQTHNGPGLVTPIAGVDLSRCGGNLTNPVRDLEWRAPQAQELNTTYRRKAAKIYTHGAAADLAPCTRCAEGKGPFQKCVVAWDDKGYVGNGNCANCYWFHKTSSCNRRYVLPCQALADEGEDLGDFEEACRIHCHGAHIPDDSGEASEEEEEDGHCEVEEDEEGDDTSEGADTGSNGDDQVRIGKRKAEDDEDEYKPTKTKKIRRFTPVNSRRA